MEVHAKKRALRERTDRKGKHGKKEPETKPPTSEDSRKVHFANVYLFRSITPRKSDFAIRPHNKQNPILGNDVIFYVILPVLPSRSLFRFKLVCKEWEREISTDPTFRQLQSRRCLRHPPSLMYWGSANNYSFLDETLKYLQVPAYIDLRASSNGLLCSAHKMGNGGPYFCVWNPFTKDVVSIPDPHKAYLPDIFQIVSLAFEPSSCNPHFTLVCPDVTSSIRTVCFTMYSSATGKWRPSNAKIHREGRDSFWPKSRARSVYVGGKLYWRITREVFWLDIKEDSGGSIAIPHSTAVYSIANKYSPAVYPDGVIGDCNGELSYIEMSPVSIDIWTLRSDEKSGPEWVQKYCLTLTEIFRNHAEEMKPCCSDAFSLLLSKNAVLIKRPTYNRKLEIGMYGRALPFDGGEVLFWVLHGKEEVIFCYNIATRVLRALHNITMNKGACFLSHKSSLALVPRAQDSLSEG